MKLSAKSRFFSWDREEEIDGGCGDGLGNGGGGTNGGGLVEFVHGGFKVFLEGGFQGFDSFVDGGDDEVFFGAEEVAEDESGSVLEGGGGLSPAFDADAESGEIGAEVGDDRFHPIVGAGTARFFYLNGSQRQIQFIEDYPDVFRWDFVEMGNSLNRFT